MRKLVGTLTAFLLLNPCWAHGVPVTEATEATDSLPIVTAANSHSPQQYVHAETETISENKGGYVSPSQKMQDEIQNLRGQVEELQHNVKLLESQTKAFYRDLDDRLNHVNGGGRSTSSSPIDAAAPKASLTPSPATKPETRPVNSAEQQDGSGLQAYSDAYDLVRQKQYARAIVAFEAFVSAYHNSELLPNAYYWLGELTLSQGEQDKAQRQFEIIINNYPLSNKTASARLKLAMIYISRGNHILARSELNRVIREYPDTAVAQIARNKLRSIQ